MTFATPRGERQLLGARPKKLTELDFRRQIVGTEGLAEIFGWEHVGWRAAQTAHGWRTPGTGTMAKGWPDLTLLRERDRRLVFAELKAESGRLREDQGRVLALLSAFATDAPATCGEFPRGMHEGEDRLGRGERRHACCPPWIQVFVWRPSDLEQIAEALR